MKDNVQPTPIDWEQRKYDLAVALYYHDIRLSDVVTPENRLARWPAHISLSAEMAVEAPAFSKTRWAAWAARSPRSR